MMQFAANSLELSLLAVNSSDVPWIHACEEVRSCALRATKKTKRLCLTHEARYDFDVSLDA